MERITSGSEKLLKEIIEHRRDNGSCDLDYWKKKFEELEDNDNQEMLVRSQFGTLKDKNMISVLWADDIPYVLFVLDSLGQIYQLTSIGYELADMLEVG